jgi:hypothetical protein
VSAPLDTERLATALVAAFRAEAVKHWPWLKGDGWPAYYEHRAQGEITQAFLVNEIAEAIAREYAGADR